MQIEIPSSNNEYETGQSRRKSRRNNEGKGKSELKRPKSRGPVG